MTGIDGRVSGLNAQVFETLKGMNVREGIGKEDAAKLKAAITADGKVDQAESDLLDELFSGQNKLTIETGTSNCTVPLELNFVDVMPGESPLQPEAARELLAKANPAVMATVRSDGAPVSAATWYLLDGDHVLLNMDDERVRLRHLRNDPRVTHQQYGSTTYSRWLEQDR